MRLWSIHPKYLYSMTLMIVWKDAIISQKILSGKTKGLKTHPQLFRFINENDPVGAIRFYLRGIYDESCSRNYHYVESNVLPHGPVPLMPVTKGQVDFEWILLLSIAIKKYPEFYEKIKDITSPDLHPSFKLVPGNREYWEQPKGTRVTHIITLHKQNRLITTLNEMVSLLKPMKFETLNAFWESNRRESLETLADHRPSLCTRTLSDDWDSPLGVSTFSLFSTITDILVGKRLGVSVNDEGFITGFLFVDLGDVEDKNKLTK